MDDACGCSSDTPHLLLQQHCGFAHTRKRPSAALFVDFKSAFYMVIRQGLFSDHLDDTTFMIAMHRLGVAPADLQRLLARAGEDVATQGLSKHVTALLTDLFKGTYFELDCLNQVALTSRGTRPVTQWEISFLFLFNLFMSHGQLCRTSPRSLALILRLCGLDMGLLLPTFSVLILSQTTPFVSWPLSMTWRCWCEHPA